MTAPDDAQTPIKCDRCGFEGFVYPPLGHVCMKFVNLTEWEELQRELAAAKAVIAACHEAIGESENSDDETLADCIKQIVTEHKAENERLMGDFSTLYAERRKLLAEVNSLKEALEKYGEHDVGCALLGTHEPCSCGLDNILDAITKE